MSTDGTQHPALEQLHASLGQTRALIKSANANLADDVCFGSPQDSEKILR